MEFFFLSLIATAFWFFQKLADWHNEHWLQWFKWAGMIFWIICWLICAYLVQYNEILMASYISILFYWIYKLKIDYTNHAIALIIILFGAFLSKEHFNSIYIGVLLFAYIVLDFIKHTFHLKKNYFFKYRLQFIVIPILYSIIIQDILWLVSMFGLFWVYLANKIFRIK